MLSCPVKSSRFYCRSTCIDYCQKCLCCVNAEEVSWLSPWILEYVLDLLNLCGTSPIPNFLESDSGLGGFASPLVCQTLIAKGVPWPHFYSGSLVVSTLNIFFIIYAFRPTQAEFESDRRTALELVNSLSGREGSAPDSKSTDGETPSTPTFVDAPPPNASKFNTS